jgi:hypothetical protein
MRWNEQRMQNEMEQTPRYEAELFLHGATVLFRRIHFFHLV